MKAILIRAFGPPEVMKVEEVPDPRPGPGQVMVKIHAVGVNPVETYIRSGAYARLPALPFTPGNDAAGVVEGVGDGVEHLRAGDRVFLTGTISGAYAEKALCQEGQVHRLPDRTSFSQGAAVNTPYSAAYRALFQRARAIPGEAVMIHGATGGVGIAAVQLARAAGMTVIGTGGTEKGRGRRAAGCSEKVAVLRKGDWELTPLLIAGFSFLSLLRHFLPASPSRLRFFSGRQEPFLPGRASPRPIAGNPPTLSRPPAGPFAPERRRG